MYIIETGENITIYDSGKQIVDFLVSGIFKAVISPDNKYLATYKCQYRDMYLIIRDLSNSQIVVSIMLDIWQMIFSNRNKFYFTIFGKVYAWNFLDPGSKPEIIFEIADYDCSLHGIRKLIYRENKIYIIYDTDHTLTEDGPDVITRSGPSSELIIMSVNLDTLEVQTIDFGQPLETRYKNPYAQGPSDRTLMTFDYKIIIINEPYLITIDLKAKTRTEVKFEEHELKDISNSSFLLLRDNNLQLIEYGSLKVIKSFPCHSMNKEFRYLTANFQNNKSAIVKLTLNSGSYEFYFLNLENGSSEKIDKAIVTNTDIYYTNYQEHFLFLIETITRIITSIRTFQQVAKYYQIAFDMVYEIIQYLLLNYQIENRELADYLNTYTRSIGATKEEFQTKISQLLINNC